mgnify:CR=1 FL=1
MTSLLLITASSTENKAKERDPDMHQTQKGRLWFFGLRAHMDVDARAGLMHSLCTTAESVHDINETVNLLNGEECFILVNSGSETV